MLKDFSQIKENAMQCISFANLNKKAVLFVLYSMGYAKEAYS